MRKYFYKGVPDAYYLTMKTWKGRYPIIGEVLSNRAAIIKVCFMTINSKIFITTFK